MTRAGHTRVVVVAALVACGLAVASFAWACVFPPDIGGVCTRSADCVSGKVCEPLDPQKPGGASACLPMPDLGGSTKCGVDDDCAHAGFPVDGFCVRDAGPDCGDVACCACPSTVVCDEGTHVDPLRCLCFPGVVDAGVVDGGP